MIYAIFGAVLIGVCLGLLGSGGSILTIPVLVYFVGHTEKAAIVEALAIVGIICLSGAIQRARAGQLDWPAALRFGPASIIGAYAGANVAVWIPGPVQLVALAAMMLAAAGSMLRPPRLTPNVPAPRATWKLAIPGFGVGLITGLIGIGGGFLIVPALVLFAGLSMNAAIGTSLALITLNCIIGFTTSIYVLREDPLVRIDPPTIAVFGAIGSVGVIIGRDIGKRLSQKTVKLIFAVFILLMAVWIMLREIPVVLELGRDHPTDQPAPDAPT